MTEHTKGPWTIIPKGTYGNKSVEINSENSPHGRVVIAELVYDGDECDQQMANAPLIAESPTILKVLEHAVNWGHGFEGTGTRPEWLTEAEEAIRKAGGKS